MLNGRILHLAILMFIISLGILTDSIPELIGGALAAFLFLAITSGFSRWKRDRIFDMRFLTKPYAPYETGESDDGMEEWAIPEGEHSVQVRVFLNDGFNFERINVRFVERYWTKKWKGWRPRIWDWRNVPKETIQVIGLSELRLKDIQSQSYIQIAELKIWPEAYGGQNGLFLRGYSCPAGESLWLKIDIKASIPWIGHLSLRGNDNRTNYGSTIRRKFTVEPNQSASHKGDSQT